MFSSIVFPLLFFFFFSFSFAAAAADAPTPGLETFENGWYDARLPVPVLHIEGGIEEVARTHGALLGRHPELRETLEFFGSTMRRRLDASAALAGHPVLRSLMKWAYGHFIRNVLVDYVPDRYREAFGQFAEAAGLDRELVLDALALPDGALRLISLFYGSELYPDLPASLGCTSIIWNSGPASVLHGRNLDYDGVGYWDRHPLILHVIPNEGLAYVAISAAGIPLPLTAFNEAGLTLAVHQLTLSDTQASGTPMPVIAAEIVRDARSIDDAIAIVRGFPRAGAWAYVLSQGRDRAVIESSPSEVVIRRSSEPYFYQTNHVSSPALAAEQIFYSPGTWLDSFLRAARLSRFDQQQSVDKSWATPERMAAMLGIDSAPTTAGGGHRIAGGTIAKLDNIQSVIMDASHRRLWVAVGTEKRAPNENRYLEYRWGDMRAADEPELTGASVDLSPTEALGTTGARLRELLRQANDSKRLAHNPGLRHTLLTEYAKEAQAQLAPLAGPATAPAPGRWAGIFLHVWDELARGPRESTPPDQLLQDINFALHDPDLAAADLKHAAGQHRVGLGRLTRGWLLDLLGRRSEALYEYDVVSRMNGFDRLQKAAERGLRRAFDWDEATELSIDFAGIDLHHY